MRSTGNILKYIFRSDTGIYSFILMHAVPPCRAPLVRLELEASVDLLEEKETLDPPEMLDLLDSLDLLLVNLYVTNTCILN